MDIAEAFELAKKGAALLSEGRQALETVKQAVETHRKAWSESDLNELSKMLVTAHADAHAAGNALDAAITRAQNR